MRAAYQSMGGPGLRLAVMSGPLAAVTASPRRWCPGGRAGLGYRGLPGGSGPGSPSSGSRPVTTMRLRPGWAQLPGPRAGTADQRRSPWLSGQDRPWTLARSRARLASFAGPGGARHVMVAEADRRVARARSRTTAAAAAQGGADRDQGDLPAGHSAGEHGDGGRGNVRAARRDGDASGGGRDDGRRGQQGAGQGGQGRGGPAQPRGSLPRRGARMRSPKGTVCGHDHLLVLGTGRLSRGPYRQLRPAGP